MSKGTSSTRRVVITGMAGITALGDNWETISSRMAAGETGIRRMHDWDGKYDLRTRLAAPVQDFTLKGKFSRKQLRSMGRVAQMSVDATDKALEMAGLRDDTAILQGGRLGIAYGSSFGSTPPVLGFTRLMEHGDSNAITATSYIQMMSHTAAVNIGVLYGISGRIIPTSTACTSGSMGIGYAYEAIKFGMQDLMIAGGAEELCPTMVAVFDTLFATSTSNDAPELSPRPYDARRDGLVIGEGERLFWKNTNTPRPAGRPFTAKSSASPAIRTAHILPNLRRIKWKSPFVNRLKVPGCHHRISISSMATAPQPIMATSPKARQPVRCLTAPFRCTRSRAISATALVHVVPSKRGLALK